MTTVSSRYATICPLETLSPRSTSTLLTTELALASTTKFGVAVINSPRAEIVVSISLREANTTPKIKKDKRLNVEINKGFDGPCLYIASVSSISNSVLASRLSNSMGSVGPVSSSILSYRATNWLDTRRFSEIVFIILIAASGFCRR